jgi:hypothetical protein
MQTIAGANKNTHFTDTFTNRSKYGTLSIDAIKGVSLETGKGLL